MSPRTDSDAQAPHQGPAWNVLGLASARAGDYEAALAHFRQAVETDPTRAIHHGNLAITLARLGDAAAALASFNRMIALEPSSAIAHFHRGNALRDLGRLQEAEVDFRCAIELQPQFAPAHSDLAEVLLALSQSDSALECCDRALKVDPNLAAAHANRGLALRRLGRLQPALDSLDRAIVLDRCLAAAYSDRAIVKRQLMGAASALADHDQAVRLNPKSAAAHAYKAVTLLELGRFDAALSAAEEAIELSSGSSEAHAIHGSVLYVHGRIPEARAAFERALELEPGFAEATLNRGLTALVMGDYRSGFRDFELRWSTPWGRRARATWPVGGARWHGETDIAGKTILLHAEQGLGDTLQFCRYVPAVVGLGVQVVLQVPLPLSRLLSDNLRGVACVISEGAEVPLHDLHCPLLSVPLALGATLDTIPARDGYLRCEASRHRRWQEYLGPRRRPRVGLVWSGGRRPDQPELHAVNERRNVPLRLLAGLHTPAVEFHSLQKGIEAEAELARVLAEGWRGPDIRDHAPELTDFSETAALVAQLDLVVSVDTSIAHLAAAMGKPVWLLNRFDSCWRWFLERADSPWYRSITLYRQRRQGDWQEVIARVAADMQQWASAQQCPPGSGSN